MKILIFGTKDDEDYAPTFSKLSGFYGHVVKFTSKDIDNIALAQRICDKNEIDKAIICRPELLESTLIHHSDYVPPINKKKITLDDYSGSLLTANGREYLVCNPFVRLHTVPYERFVVDRYIRKLTKPSSWFKQTAFKYQELNSESVLNTVVLRLTGARLIGIDIETAQGETKPITCVSYTGYFADTHSTETYCIPFTSREAYYFCRNINANSVAKVFQRGIYDNAYFLRWGMPVNNWLHDTLNLFHCMHSELPKDLAFITAFAIRDIRYWKDDGKTGGISALCRYCGKDSWATVNSYLSLLAEAESYAFNNYAFHEFPMVFPALHAAMEGIRVDPEVYKEVHKESVNAAEMDLKRIRLILRSPNFNPRSPKQMILLFKVLLIQETSSAKAAMDRAKFTGVFNEWLLTMVTDYKKSAKRISDFFHDNLTWYGRMFFEIDPAGTDTGRTASKASAFWCGHSIQTIPSAMKKVFISDPGWELAEIDKRQSEARCVGYLSGETALINLVESENDYHAWNASAFFGIPYPELFDNATRKILNKPVRNTSKKTNHGANYNMTEGVLLDTMGPKAVAETKITLKLPKNWSLREVCTYLLNRYDSTYPGVRGAYYENIISRIAKFKRLVSPLGWTRVFHGDPSKNKPALNAAVAHEPQNLSVAIVNREWYDIWHATVYGSFKGKVRIIGQIHDSLLFQYRGGKETVEAVAGMMNTSVEVTDIKGITRTMLIPSDISCGATRWSELKD